VTVTATAPTVADTEWVLCGGCDAPVYGKRFSRDLHVCAVCGRHAPLTAAQRLAQLADEGSVELLGDLPGGEDPLGFVDTQPYTARLASARAATGMDEAVLCARVTIERVPAVLAVMDFRFMGGSLGTVVGERITRAAETALTERHPLVIVTSSGGARMQEGALSLMQMAKTSAALAQLDEAGVLTISVVADPTFGGVAASFATLADVIVAEPGARLGFAGRRIIEQTIRQELPPEFQTAEMLVERGFVDMVVPRDRLRRAIGHLLHVARGATEPPRADGSDDGSDGLVVRDHRRLPEPDPWEAVQKARHLDRPTALDHIAGGFDDFQELRGDRVSGDCAAVVGGTAWIDGRPVVVIGQQKGHDVSSLLTRNFGMARPAGFRKAARLMRLAAKMGLPVVTLVDTPGAYPGRDAEEQGQAVAIAENLRLMASLPVPVLTVVIGEGGSGGALALAVANRVLMFSDSVYSVISPEGCASIIWKSPTEAARAAAALGLTARDLLRLQVVDGVIPEPEGGTGAAPLVAADRLRAAVAHGLRELAELAPEALVADRRARFRHFGQAGPAAPWPAHPSATVASASGSASASAAPPADSDDPRPALCSTRS
jgi:acetyl-CoA carboxylase carboxyl transferase subunit beta